MIMNLEQRRREVRKYTQIRRTYNLDLEESTMARTRIKISKIANDCKNPERAYRAMMTGITARYKLDKAYNRLDMMREMAKYNLVLNSTEKLSKQICSSIKHKPNKDKEVSKQIMKWKLQDTYTDLRHQQSEYNETLKNNKEILRPEHYAIKARYSSAFKIALSDLRHYTRTKTKKKIAFLKNRKNEETRINRHRVTEVEGIQISDKPIPDEFESRPRCYGGTVLATEEEKVLALPPKFAIYGDVNKRDCEAEIEKALTKLRWSKMNEGKESRQYVYDASCKELDFRKQRPTDFPFNKRTIAPKPGEKEEEIKMLNLKQELMKEIGSYIKENNNMKMSNLTTEEKKGIQSLKKRKDLIIAQTDKSGRFSIDSRDNYMEAMQTHIENDDTITEEEHEEAQKEINAHSIFWCRILSLSKETGKNEEANERNHLRSKNNLLVDSCELPPVYGLRKDHKAVENDYKGPPLRPVCDATSGYLNKLAHLMSKILIQFWKNEEENCTSTEELLADFDELNEVGLTSEHFVGSADVKALYPSLDIDCVIENVGKMIVESEIDVKGLDMQELGLYLSLTRDRQYLEDRGIASWCPTRRTHLGRKPKITAHANKEDRKSRFEIWIPITQQPEEKVVQKAMFAEGIKVALEKIMKNHFYAFGESKRRQKEGGPIGLVLTDPVAKIFMTYWDRCFKRAAEEQGFEIALYRRYVDDITIIAREVSNGTGNDEMEDGGKPRDERGMNRLQEIGNSIMPSIQIEVEYPSKYTEKKMPVLDIKVWVERQQNEEQYEILYEFYAKKIATKMVLHARSAIPWRDKRNILTQEVIRRLKNCSLSLPWRMKSEHLEEFNLKMQFSGYTAKFRAEVLKSGIQAYDKMRENDKKKKVPLHRPRKWKQQEREEEKRYKRENWYRRGNNDSVIFIPATPKGELKRRLMEKVQNVEIGLRIVEKNGTTMKSMFQRAKLDKAPCADKSCLVCKKDKKYICRQESVTYEMKCETCEAQYIGETSRTAYTRIKEHMMDQKNKTENSVLWRHSRDNHGGEEQAVEAKVRKGFRGDATLRQITEALDIKHEMPTINQKEEWAGPLRLPQLEVNTE